MDFGFASELTEFRTRVRAILSETTAEADDERALYRLLGGAGILGVAWPKRYGGHGGTMAEAAVVLEEIVRASVPDTLFVNSIQTAGELLLSVGTEEQKQRFLPRMARGELFISILYTEPEAGSDLAALTCSAFPAEGGFRLTGTKAYSLGSGIADFGLCAARTSPGSSRYDGITMFLVDLRTVGVRVRELPSLPDEQFSLVVFEDVLVSEDCVVGGPGDGWAILAQALPLERTGLDFAARARRWYQAGTADLDDPLWAERAGRYGASVQAAWLLAWRATMAVASGKAHPAYLCTAKWYSGELSAELAGWILQRFGVDAPDDMWKLADRAYREAPGLTLAGGTSEVMLQELSGILPDIADPTAGHGCDTRLEPTATQRDIASAVRMKIRQLRERAPGLPAPAGHVHECLAELGIFALEIPAEADGLALGLSHGVMVCGELGRAAAQEDYRALTLLADVLSADGTSLPGIGPGRVKAAVASGAAPVRGCASGLVGRTTVATADAGARYLIVPARAEDGSRLLAVVPPEAEGVTVLDARGELRTVELHRAQPVATVPAAGEGGMPSAIAVRAWIRHAAYLIGLARGSHQLAVRRAWQRSQFQRPIAAHQAIAFPLSRQFARLEGGDLLVHRAAWLADREMDAAVAATQALAFASELALNVTNWAVHVHGAFGLTRQAPAHYHYRLAAAEALWWGSPAAHWQLASSLRKEASCQD